MFPASSALLCGINVVVTAGKVDVAVMDYVFEVSCSGSWQQLGRAALTRLRSHFHVDLSDEALIRCLFYCEAKKQAFG